MSRSADCMAACTSIIAVARIVHLSSSRDMYCTLCATVSLLARGIRPRKLSIARLSRTLLVGADGLLGVFCCAGMDCGGVVGAVRKMVSTMRRRKPIAL